jgi:ribonuclease HII
MRNNLFEFENNLWNNGIRLIAGIDEVGRGSIAGPVVSAAVIFNKGEYIEGVNDSKKLTRNKREKLFEIIIEKAISYGIGIVSEKEIDKMNILNATLLSMGMAVENLGIKPEFLLIDGNIMPPVSYSAKTIIKGDSKSFSIASASIIAKVTRDKIMRDYNDIYPVYLFSKNKGYATKEHINAVKKAGLCSIHRRTFCRRILSSEQIVFKYS